MVPLNHLEFFSRDLTGSCCKALSQSIIGMLSATFSCCTYVLPVTLRCLKQCFVAGSPIISGLDFDMGGREQDCRNPGNLTECKIFYKDNLKHVQGTAKRNT